MRGRESRGQRGDSRLTCFHWLRSEVSADCGSPIKLFPHLDACHCENPFNGLSHARLRCPKSLKRRSGVFSVREGRTGTFSKSLRPRCCYCCRIFWFFFSVLEMPEESRQGQQFRSQQGAVWGWGWGGRVLAVSEGSYLSTHHWLLTYLTAGRCNNSLGLRSLPTEPETHTHACLQERWCNVSNTRINFIRKSKSPQLWKTLRNIQLTGLFIPRCESREFNGPIICFEVLVGTLLNAGPGWLNFKRTLSSE